MTRRSPHLLLQQLLPHRRVRLRLLPQLLLQRFLQPPNCALLPGGLVVRRQRIRRLLLSALRLLLHRLCGRLPLCRAAVSRLLCRRLRIRAFCQPRLQTLQLLSQDLGLLLDCIRIGSGSGCRRTLLIRLCGCLLRLLRRRRLALPGILQRFGIVNRGGSAAASVVQLRSQPSAVCLGGLRGRLPPARLRGRGLCRRALLRGCRLRLLQLLAVPLWGCRIVAAVTLGLLRSREPADLMPQRRRLGCVRLQPCLPVFLSIVQPLIRLRVMSACIRGC